MDDFKLITIDPSTRRVTLKPPTPPQKISGIDKLIQIVVLALYSDPGRNAFDPERGAGLISLIGSNIDPDDPTEVIAAISERLEKIKSEIIDSQSGLENESPDERLSDLIVLNVDQGTNIDEVMVKFRIVSESGLTVNLVV